MASTLTGLFRTLAWSDFPPPRAGAAPGPGQHATAAMTHSGASFGGVHFGHRAGTRPPRFSLRDTLSVRATFTKASSFVMAWLFTRSQTDQDDLLHHEQGHYDISALLARDFFVEMMLIKGDSFPSGEAGLRQMRAIKATTLDKMAAIQKLYDDEVHPQQQAGQSRGPAQVTWDGIMRDAFTRPRDSGTTDPSGVPHKERLVHALSRSGRVV